MSGCHVYVMLRVCWLRKVCLMAVNMKNIKHFTNWSSLWKIYNRIIVMCNDALINLSLVV